MIPIVSFVGIPTEELVLVSEDEKYRYYKLPFTNKEFADMREDFGEYCVVISGEELEEKILNYCNSNGCDYLFDRIIYCDQHNSDKIEAFLHGKKERFLYKSLDLAWQREYRLVVSIAIPEDHYIRIGKLSGTLCLESKQLQDYHFAIPKQPLEL